MSNPTITANELENQCMSNPTITVTELENMLPLMLAAPKFQALGLVSAPAMGKTQFFQHRMPELLAESRGIDVADVGLVIEKVGQREDAASICGLTLPSKDANGNLITVGSKPYLLQRIEATGKDHGIILFDEALQANADIQKALADTFNVTEHKIGDWDLPEGWVVVFTGNRAKDKSGAVRLLSHLRAGRAIVFELAFDIHGWAEWARDNGVHPLLIDCAVSHSDFFDDEVPVGDGAFCTPRSVTMASHHLTAFFETDEFDGNYLPSYVQKLLAANMGARAGGLVSRFIAMADKVPTGDQILHDPKGANVPDETGYQLLAGNRAISACYNAATGEAALEYIVRLRADLQISLGTKLLYHSSKRGWALSSDTAVAFATKYAELLPLAFTRG